MRWSNLLGGLGAQVNAGANLALLRRVATRSGARALANGRLAQGIVVGFADSAPVEETKPVISLIDPEPVLWPWQIDLAREVGVDLAALRPAIAASRPQMRR